MGYDPLKNVGYGIWGQKWDVGYHYQKFPKMVSNLSYFPINHTLVSNIAYHNGVLSNQTPGQKW